MSYYNIINCEFKGEGIMECFSRKSTEYFTKKYSLNSMDSARVKYSIEVIMNEVSKLILLMILFSIGGELRAFIYALITLSLFRPLLGGLHFVGFIKCYFFTMFFFVATVFLTHYINIDTYLLTLLFFLNLITLVKFKTTVQLNKLKYNKVQILSQKNIPIIIFCVYVILFLFLIDNMYLKVSIWTITLQSIQLIISKGVEYYEKK